MSQLRAIGIELGATRCVVSSINEVGHSEILVDREGERLIPNVVYFGDDRVAIGHEALLRGKDRPDRMATCIQRELGKTDFRQPIGGHRMPPQVIQACLLRGLAGVARRAGGDDNVSTVIAVPAYFNEPQRQATAEAAEMAGLRLIDIINRPIAAALAFSEYRGFSKRSGDASPHTPVLVFDMDEFSCEATLLVVGDRQMRMVGTDHQRSLGSNDWDRRLAEHLAQQFRDTHNIDLLAERSTREMLMNKAIRARHALNLRYQTHSTLSYQDCKLEVLTQRNHFASSTNDLLYRASKLCEKVVQNGGYQWEGIERLLLVGSGTQMPMIRSMLRRRLGRDADASVSADEAIARGAALYAAHRLALAGSDGGAKAIEISNVSTHSLGVEGLDTVTGRKVNKVIIKRGTPLPAKASREFVTKATAQRNVRIVVLEGEENEPEKCTVIGKAVISNLPDDLHKEWPVEVTYAYLANGRLRIDARLRYTEHAVHLELLRTASISRVHLERWKQAVISGRGLNAFLAVISREAKDKNPPPIALAGAEEHDEKPQSAVGRLVRQWTSLARQVLHREDTEPSEEEQQKPPPSPVEVPTSEEPVT